MSHEMWLEGVSDKSPIELKSAMDRLASYEATGLTPVEVRGLQVEVTALRAEVDRLHKENFWLTQNGGK